jgi:hypothetical protein
MRNLVLMFLVGLGAFALLSTAADAALVKLTKQQVQRCVTAAIIASKIAA